MGHAKVNYLHKQAQQRINSNENREYYQNDSKQKYPSSDRDRAERRKDVKP